MPERRSLSGIEESQKNIDPESPARHLFGRLGWVSHQVGETPVCSAGVRSSIERKRENNSIALDAGKAFARSGITSLFKAALDDSRYT
jgi:hypothetical protein